MITTNNYLQTIGTLTVKLGERTPKDVLTEEAQLVKAALGWDTANVTYSGLTAYIKSGNDGLELSAGPTKANGLEVILTATATFSTEGMPLNSIETPKAI
ncbi:hypothetical protein HYU18_04965, partial [Candidatus Woesearchaeota archaeon]|nr:hypothetical protein [Candidatus Woesearchaeota archaeon]